jgi:GTP-binding protein
VGKSSLINALAGRPIARTSATPGRTRLANFYRVTLAAPTRAGGRRSIVYLVDLPGYGYARGGRDARRAFAGIAEGSLAGAGAALLVVDARHPALDSDRGARDWLAESGVTFGVVATKVDKLSRAERTRALKTITATLEGPALAFSAATGEGRDDLWNMIVELARAQVERPARE